MRGSTTPGSFVRYACSRAPRPHVLPILLSNEELESIAVTDLDLVLLLIPQ